MQAVYAQRLPVSEETDRIAKEIVDAAFRVHRTLGPGLLESVYEVCMAHELRKRNLSFDAQLPMPVVYDGLKIDGGYRVDLLVEQRVIVELKAVEALLPIHTAQVLTYLRLSGCRLGLLINFNVEIIKKGIKRIAF